MAPFKGANRVIARRMSQHRLPHIPALDGIRGVAVGAVLVFHSYASALPGGYLGVSLFFTLSGFLITAQLLYERERSAHISLRGFWLRRAKRLLPAIFLALFVVALLSTWIVDDQQLSSLRVDGLAGLLYVANWRFIESSGAYAEQFVGDANPLIHLWSLAIEEQFYLLFPLIAAAVLRFGRRAFALALGALLVASVLATTLLATSGAAAERIYYGTDTRAFEILIGAALAYVYVERPRLPARSVRSLSVTGASALGAMIIAAATWDIDNPIVYDGGLAIFGAASAILLASAVWGSRLTDWVFDRRPLRSLGLISYGVYLFHWPIFVFVQRQGWPLATELAVEVGATLAVAVASYHLVESPIRRGDLRLPSVALAPAAAVAVVVALLVAVPAPSGNVIVFSAVAERDVASAAGPVTDEAPTISTTIAPTSAAEQAAAERVEPAAQATPGATGSEPPRILLVGDSVMITVGRGLERWGQLTGAATFINAGGLGCAVARGGQVLVEGNEYDSPSDCDRWAEYWPKLLSTTDPDAVVLLTGVWDINDRTFPLWPEGWQAPGDDVFDRWLASEFDQAFGVLGATGAEVIWLSSPCYEKFDANGEITIPGGSFDLDRVRHLNDTIVPSALSRNPRVQSIDFHEQICPDGRGLQRLGDVEPIRPDGVHFSEDGSDALAVRLGPQLIAALDGSD